MLHSIYRIKKAIINRVLPKPEVCLDVSDWASRHGVHSELLHEPVYDEIAPILFADDRGQKTLSYFENDFKREQRLVVIENAKIRLNEGILVLPDGSICQQGMWYVDFLLKHPGYSRVAPPKKQVIEGKSYSLLSKWSNEYYHWFYDVLPRLYKALPYLSGETTFLINGSPKLYQIISLAALGVTSDKLIEKLEDSDTHVKQLYYATPLGHTNGTSGEVLKGIGKAVVKHVNRYHSKSLQNYKRIWITRKEAKTRKILNENSLLPILERFGFVSISMESLTWEGQVSLLHSAEYIVGLHGAGLMNTLFAPNLISLGEIGFEGVLPHYKTLAKQCEVGYSRLNAVIADSVYNDINVHVDQHEFEDWLAQIVDIRRHTTKRTKF